MLITYWSTLQAADIIGVTVLFPGAIFAMAGGAIFGVGYGSLLVWIATSLGQTLAFMIGRCSAHCASHISDTCGALRSQISRREGTAVQWFWIAGLSPVRLESSYLQGPLANDE